MGKNKKLTFKKKRGERLDRFISDSLEDVSRSQATKLIKDEHVLVNDAARKPSHLLKAGDEVIVILNAPKADAAVSLRPEKVPFRVIAETKHYIVVNKPAGVITHPDGFADRGPSLIEGVLVKYPEVADVGDDPSRPGVVHRLDVYTSGLIVIARSQKGFTDLKQQFMNRTMKKEYKALVHGRFQQKHGEVRMPIVRSRRAPGQFVAVEDAAVQKQRGKGKMRAAITAYEVKEEFPDTSLVLVRPKTGRTHQIRVHMKAIGHPIVGDTVYTTKAAKRVQFPYELERYFLHASTLAFKEPGSGKRVVFESRLPRELTAFLRTQRNQAKEAKGSGEE